MTSNGSVKIVGGLLQADLLGKILAGDKDVPGIEPETYGLEKGESIRRQASRSWPYLQEVWQEYKARREAAPETSSASQVQKRWLNILLRELGFTKLSSSGSVEIDGKTFPVSHRYEHVPVHLLGWGVDLDKRTPKVTARAPHSMMQELLNRSEGQLWALLSNGQSLRLLRDSATLTGQAYLEFDLQAIFDGEAFSDFTRLYLVCHESRFVPVGDGGLASCYLEQWRSHAAAQGERALNELRRSVETAISELGTGFLAHPDNPHLRARLDPRGNELNIDDFNRSLLRLVYRLLFWFVAEDRDVLLTPVPEEKAAAQQALETRKRYTKYFSSDRLRKLARKRRGDRHGDLWESAQLVLNALGEEGGVGELGLPGLGGIFESRLPEGRALPLDEPLDGARLSNRALLSAIHALAYKQSSSGGGLRPVDFGNLGAEELGSVYEGLLELRAHYDDETRVYSLETLPGNERKETGSYYTPTSLVECLLDSTLDPLLDEACTAETSDQRVAALLDITVCDPACGSGHFLVAAARRIAKRVAAEETSEPEPPESVVRAALRRVVGRCIYGVDINPMAAELAKVSLWIEALEPGKPLSYLDASIRVGNALLGTTPALLEAGLPSAAFVALEGDDKKITSALKKQNTEENAGQADLFSTGGIPVSNATLAKRAGDIVQVLPESLEDLHIHQRRLAQELAGSDELRRQKLLADAWCAAFVQPKTEVTRSTAITHATIEQLAGDNDFSHRTTIEARIRELIRQYRFFHWHVEFPHLFQVGDGVRDLDPETGWAGGFSCVLGNPPWERVKLQEQEFFASRHERITKAANATARKKLIATLAQSEDEADRKLDQEFRAELRASAGSSHLLRASGRYPKTGSGDINTYAVFAETGRTVLRPTGRAGMVLPTGIATDATTAPFMSGLVRKGNLVHVYGFRNNKGLFKGVGHGDVRFCLLAFGGALVKLPHSRFSFELGFPREIKEPGRTYTLPREAIDLVNPNTGNCPTFNSPRDAKIILDIYQRVPVLWKEDPEANPWRLSFLRMLDMANDSALFRTKDELAEAGWKLTGNIYAENDQRMLPLHEGKMFYHFDHRFGDYRNRAADRIDSVLPRSSVEDKMTPGFTTFPRYWVDEQEVNDRLQRRSWNKGWLLGWRDICRSSDERTMIASVLPRTATPDGTLLMFPDRESPHGLAANLSAFAFDYVVRQKSSGSHLKYFTVRQLPVLPPSTYETPVGWLGQATPEDWIRERVLELSYTADDLAAFAQELGDDGPPFVWDEERRFAMRAELDAAYFHLYGIERDDLIYIMDSFRAFQNNDLDRFVRTKQLILDVYDAMTEATRAGDPYRTILDPAPGRGPRHPARTEV